MLTNEEMITAYAETMNIPIKMATRVVNEHRENLTRLTHNHRFYIYDPRTASWLITC